MGLARTAFAPSHVHIVDLAAPSTLVLEVYLHDFNLLHTVLLQLRLVLLQQLFRNGQLSHFLGSFHPDYHVV